MFVTTVTRKTKLQTKNWGVWWRHNIFPSKKTLKCFFLTAFLPFWGHWRWSLTQLYKAGSITGWVASSLQFSMWAHLGFGTLLKGNLALLWRCSGTFPYQNTFHALGLDLKPSTSQSSPHKTELPLPLTLKWSRFSFVSIYRSQNPVYWYFNEIKV